MAATALSLAKQKIAFRSDRDHLYKGSIYIMNADGSEQTRLTSGDIDDREPDISADGSKIVFASFVQHEQSYNIFVMNSDGTGLKRLTMGHTEDHYPTWSPDGTLIAFCRRGNGLDVWVMNADGTNPHKVADIGEDQEVTWSPDGTRLAFAAYGGGDNARIYLVNADGSGLTRLTELASANYDPAWSPDGTRIAFTSNRHNSNFDAHIFIMNADGSNVRQLTFGAEYQEMPCFSLDGSRIAFVSGPSELNFNIYLMNVDGSNVVPLTTTYGDDLDPAFGPAVTVDKTPTEISIGNADAIESLASDSPDGLVNVTLAVTLSRPVLRTVEVQYATGPTDNYRATDNVDYVTIAPTTLSFAPGETSKDITVQIKGDRIHEGLERFAVNLFNPLNAGLKDREGVITIIDDDPIPVLRISDATVTEGNSGSKNVFIPVRLSAVSGQSVSVEVSSVPANSNAATAGTDYVALPPTRLSFAPGETRKEVMVTITGDTLNESDERLSLRLRGAVNARVLDPEGIVTIINDDAAPTLSINDVSLAEGNSSTTYFTFTVTLSTISAKTVTVKYQTTTPSGSPATAGTDYIAVPPATLTFAPGETSKPVTVQVNGDTTVEGNEKFVVRLSNAANATIADSEGFGTILNDDAAAPLLFPDDAPSE